MRHFYLVSLLVTGLNILAIRAFDNSRTDNIAVYWGQNSYGATHPSDTGNWQQKLAYYCQDDSIDVIPLAFLHIFFSIGGLPSLDLSSTCSSAGNGAFPGTALPNCAFLANDIKACQAKGKIITLSLGGATGSTAFTSTAQARAFADTIWNLFLGGSSSTRPFGDAVLDGIDLDIETGAGGSYFVTFATRLRELYTSGSKKYYLTGAPQCPFPDASLGTVVNAVKFDALYVQFYNNWCGLQNFDNIWAWNFGTWDTWAKTTSPNPDIKIYVGAPASASAAGSGYVDMATLASYVLTTRSKYSSFGGVMFWDASQAYANNRIDAAIKAVLRTGAVPSTTKMTTSTSKASTSIKPASSSLGLPTGNVQLASPSTTKTSSSPTMSSSSMRTSSTKTSSFTNISSTKSASAFSTTYSTRTSSVSSSKTSTMKTGTTSTFKITSTAASSATKTSTAAPSVTSTVDCSGIEDWSSKTVYFGRGKAVYNSHIWVAKWWSYNDEPGGVTGVWSNKGICVDEGDDDDDDDGCEGDGVGTGAATPAAKIRVVRYVDERHAISELEALDPTNSVHAVPALHHALRSRLFRF